MDADGKLFMPLRPAAWKLGLPIAWLKAEAHAGRVPCVRSGRRLFFNIEALERRLIEQANASGVFVTPRRAARLLGIPEAFLRREVVHGRIPHLKDGARILVNPEAVRAALLNRDGGSSDGGDR